MTFSVWTLIDVGLLEGLGGILFAQIDSVRHYLTKSNCAIIPLIFIYHSDARFSAVSLLHVKHSTPECRSIVSSCRLMIIRRKLDNSPHP